MPPPDHPTPHTHTVTSLPTPPLTQDPLEIERHMAGKRFRKLKQQHDEAEAAREARKHLPKDSAEAIEDRIGELPMCRGACSGLCCPACSAGAET